MGKEKVCSLSSMAMTSCRSHQHVAGHGAGHLDPPPKWKTTCWEWKNAGEGHVFRKDSTALCSKFQNPFLDTPSVPGIDKGSVPELRVLSD